MNERTKKAAVASRSEPELVKAMDLLNELPNGGKHLPLYKDANVLLQRLTEEKKLLEMLDAAIRSRSKEPILSAVNAAKKMSPPFEHPKIGEAERLIAEIEKLEAVCTG